MLNNMTHDEYVPKGRIQNYMKPIYPKLSLPNYRIWTYFTINDLICSTAGSCPAIILLRVKSPKTDDSRGFLTGCQNNTAKSSEVLILQKWDLQYQIKWSDPMNTAKTIMWRWSSPDLAMNKWSQEVIKQTADVIIPCWTLRKKHLGNRRLTDFNAWVYF